MLYDDIDKIIWKAPVNDQLNVCKNINIFYINSMEILKMCTNINSQAYCHKQSTHTIEDVRISDEHCMHRYQPA